MIDYRKPILIVEDSQDDLLSLKRSLKKAGVEQPVQVVMDGREAIGYLSGTGSYSDREAYPLPSIVFLDLKLPYVMGFQVLKWIRDHSELNVLPVVILSGSDEERDHVEAESLQAKAYLVKPASPEDIQSVLSPLGLSTYLI